MVLVTFGGSVDGCGFFLARISFLEIVMGLTFGRDSYVSGMVNRGGKEKEMER